MARPKDKKSKSEEHTIDAEVDRSRDVSPPPSPQGLTQNFESVYLQQASKEFAEDLEKLRTANDFRGDKSVAILVEALRQGVSCYSEDEKERILNR